MRSGMNSRSGGVGNDDDLAGGGAGLGVANGVGDVGQREDPGDASGDHAGGELRAELQAAHETLTAIGMTSFATRAAQELIATGQRPRREGSNPLELLTAQERLIVGRVSAGATSKEVAVALFLSPRTIDAHLRNIYRKLEISSRRQLRELVL